MTTTSPVKARERVEQALGSLPLDADALYLEWCLDTCRTCLFHPHFPAIARASRPRCSGALMLTVQGAKKLERLLAEEAMPQTGEDVSREQQMQQTQHGYSHVDEVLAQACAEGHVICYKLRRPVFARDARWGDDEGQACLDAGRDKHDEGMLDEGSHKHASMRLVGAHRRFLCEHFPQTLNHEP